MPEVQLVSDYSKLARFFFSGQAKGVEEIIIDGERIRYDNNTGYFGVLAKDGKTVKTIFRPDEGRQYYLDEIQRRRTAAGSP